MVNEFKLLHAQTRCRSVHAREFTAGQKKLWKIRTGPPGPCAARPLGLQAAKPLGCRGLRARTCF